MPAAPIDVTIARHAMQAIERLVELIHEQIAQDNDVGTAALDAVLQHVGQMLAISASPAGL